MGVTSKQGPAVGANARVNYRNVDGIRWEVGVVDPQHEGGLPQVLGLEVVGQVNDHGLGVDVENDALHHPDEGRRTGQSRWSGQWAVSRAYQ